MTGPIENEKNKDLKDVSKLELCTLIPILIFIVWIGVQPNTFLKISENSVKKVLLIYDSAKQRINNNDAVPK